MIPLYIFFFWVTNWTKLETVIKASSIAHVYRRHVKVQKCKVAQMTYLSFLSTLITLIVTNNFISTWTNWVELKFILRLEKKSARLIFRVDWKICGQKYFFVFLLYWALYNFMTSHVCVCSVVILFLCFVSLIKPSLWRGTKRVSEFYVSF